MEISPSVRTQYQDATHLDARIALHARYSINPYGWQRWVFDRLLDGEVHQVLELGCGPGNLWLENAARIPADWEITLTDQSAGMVEAARRNLHGIDNRFAIATVDVQAIPFADARFDLVIANHMLYHVPERPRALAEIRRVLRPGGRLCAATNGADHLFELREWQERFGLGGGRPAELTAAGFTLENGSEQLQPWFANISVERYEDSLQVDEAASLVAYVRSGLDAETQADPATPARLEALAAALERQLRADGSIRIRKSAGLFTAR